MGAEPWSCFTPYQSDVDAALRAAQAREFAEGRYRILDPDHPPRSISDAIEQCDASGTCSVLDMAGVAETPRDSAGGGFELGILPESFALVAPLRPEQLIDLYGTEKPTRDLVETNYDFYDWIDRGMGIYVVVYENDAPSEIFFAGYSFD
ncbi:MAG: hypothetical protein U0835_11350 [Isosphaeraceae bacterium]